MKGFTRLDKKSKELLEIEKRSKVSINNNKQITIKTLIVNTILPKINTGL